MTSKSDYKTAILDYLKKHSGENISRDVLMSETNVSKSRLTEVIQSIKSDGYAVVTPPRSGIVRFENKEQHDLLPTIKNSDIRRWIILFLLSRYGRLTFRELLLKLMYMRDDTFDQMKILVDADSQCSAYDDSSLIQTIRDNVSYSDDDEIEVAKDIVSVTALRKDLLVLREQGLVIMIKSEHTEYCLSDIAPVIVPISGDSLFEFCQRHNETVSSVSDVTPLKQAYERIKHLIAYEDGDIANGRFGRINEITQEQIDNFNLFIKHPYRTNLLEFKSAIHGKTKVYCFAVGLIFYSVETGLFYVLGENKASKRIECQRIDWLEEINDCIETHSEYRSEKYYSIYSEMFSSQYEDNAYEVKVLFSDFGNVPKRFADLRSIRPNASIRIINNKPADCIYSYIYEDTVRGLSDFARYLRGFGMSVLALEPPELKEKMLFTYNRIIEKYEESNE